MTRTRLAVPIVAAAALTALSGTVALPVANAREEVQLSNGLLLIVPDAGPGGIVQGARTLGRPLVDGDLVTQQINVRRTGKPQFELPIDASNSLSDTFDIFPGMTVEVQACRTPFASSSICTAFSSYTYTPPAEAAPAPPIDVAPPPEVPKPPVICPAGSPVPEVPAGQTCPPPKAVAPTNAVTVNIQEAGLQVNVAVANTSDLTAQCTYNAEEVNGLGPSANRDFTLGPRGNTTLTFPAPVLLQQYRVEVACTADFEGKSVEIGRVVQNI